MSSRHFCYKDDKVCLGRENVEERDKEEGGGEALDDKVCLGSNARGKTLLPDDLHSYVAEWPHYVMELRSHCTHTQAVRNTYSSLFHTQPPTLPVYVCLPLTVGM